MQTRVEIESSLAAKGPLVQSTKSTGGGDNTTAAPAKGDKPAKGNGETDNRTTNKNKPDKDGNTGKGNKNNNNNNTTNHNGTRRDQPPRRDQCLRKDKDGNSMPPTPRTPKGAKVLDATLKTWVCPFIQTRYNGGKICKFPKTCKI